MYERMIKVANEISKIEYAVEILPQRLKSAVMRIPEIEKMRIQDIRLRLMRYLSVTIFDSEYFVTENGVITRSSANAVKVLKEDMEYTFNTAFQNSIHSFKREISQGYITIKGGNRVGFCGNAVFNPMREGYVDSVKDVSSIAIRISREIKGCSNEIFSKVFTDEAKSLLIIGPPCSGKTTVLRDLCVSLSKNHRVSLIDERNEISSTVAGVSQNNIGDLSDVFCCYNKYEGIMTAVKVMSPEFLVCDEIGSKNDSKALEYAINSGVKLIATAHCTDYDDAKRRVTVSGLLKDRVFDYVAVLGKGSMCGKLIKLVKTGGKNA